jgi:ribosomal protein L28
MNGGLQNISISKTMAKMCEICGKQKSVGNTRKLLRGHYNITSGRSFRPNLQKTTYQGKKVLACTRCIRSETKAGKVDMPA